jgi:arsenite transporter
MGRAATSRDPGPEDAKDANGVSRALGGSHNVACPSPVIGASNLFELEIAATALFGFQSETVLATAIGVLVEVPVMLSVIRIVLPPRGWYQRRTLTREERAGVYE